MTFYSTTIEQSSSFSAASFDHICAYNILHLVHDLDATLAKLFALLKPGGSFISSTACLRETWVPVGLMLPLMRWVGKAPHVLMLSVADLKESLQRAGFADVTLKKVSDAKTTAFVLASKPA